MELKPGLLGLGTSAANLLIVLNGIETINRENNEFNRQMLLIVLNGIETKFRQIIRLILIKTFNRTKWN